jgi:hypothetical protein
MRSKTYLEAPSVQADAEGLRLTLGADPTDSAPAESEQSIRPRTLEAVAGFHPWPPIIKSKGYANCQLRRRPDYKSDCPRGINEFKELP